MPLISDSQTAINGLWRSEVSVCDRQRVLSLAHDRQNADLELANQKIKIMNGKSEDQRIVVHGRAQWCVAFLAGGEFNVSYRNSIKIEQLNSMIKEKIYE